MTGASTNELTSAEDRDPFAGTPGTSQYRPVWSRSANRYSTVTVFARFLGLSTSRPRALAM